MDTGLQGKTVVITGGGGGIGRECAVQFAAEGCHIVVSDVNLDAARAVAGELGAGGTRAIAVQTDVTDVTSTRDLMQAAVDTFGSLDVLVNNAGVFQSKPLDDITADEWDRVLSVNLKGVFLCAQAALKHMKATRSGKIISVGSLAGQVGGIHAGANYATSKAGVISLTKSLAKNAGPFGINVNCVNPGIIETDMTRPWPADVLDRLKQNTPLGRLGKPAEVASVIVFLASSAASFIHGAHVDINGGINMD